MRGVREPHLSTCCGSWEVRDLHLVSCTVCTAANDVDNTIALGRDGVLAHILKPDELQVAGTEAVDTLALVRTTAILVSRCNLQPIEKDDTNMMTLRRVAPSSNTKTVSASPPSVWPLQAPGPRSYLTQPASNVSPARMY